MKPNPKEVKDEEKENGRETAEEKVTRVVMFSGGLGSWAAAKRVAAKFGTDNLTLVFTDTCMEDEDLYRFLYEGAANVGGELVTLKDGRTPWQVYEDTRFIGNSKVDPCARVLKRELFTKWRDENCDPLNTVVYVGIDWTESHRLTKIQKYVVPWIYEAPLCERPLRAKWEIFQDLKAEGIEPPRLYKLGFAHNNCGGFCCKAGFAHFRLLLRTMPERYAIHEAEEQRLRSLGINGTILATRIGGPKRPITLKEFRETVEREPDQLNLFEQDDLAAGCGCAL